MTLKPLTAVKMHNDPQFCHNIAIYYLTKRKVKTRRRTTAPHPGLYDLEQAVVFHHPQNRLLTRLRRRDLGDPSNLPRSQPRFSVLHFPPRERSSKQVISLFAGGVLWGTP